MKEIFEFLFAVRELKSASLTMIEEISAEMAKLDRQNGLEVIIYDDLRKERSRLRNALVKDEARA